MRSIEGTENAKFALFAKNLAPKDLSRLFPDHASDSSLPELRRFVILNEVKNLVNCIVE